MTHDEKGKSVDETSVAPPVESEPTVGMYRHWSGKLCRMLRVESNGSGPTIRVVVYESEDLQQWVQTVAAWSELVEWRDGVKRPRFVRVPSLIHKDVRVVLSASVAPGLRDSAREAAKAANLEFSKWVERAVRQTVARESKDRTMASARERGECLACGYDPCACDQQ